MDPDGDNIFSKTFRLPPGGDSLAYYYLTTSTWDNYLNFRESVPQECALKWGSDRVIIIPIRDTIVNHLWGSCDSIGTSTLHVLDLYQGADEILIFPNPATGRFFLRLPETFIESHVCIYEISGKEIYINTSYSSPSELLFEIGHLTSGIYIVKIQHKDMINTRRLVIKKG